jgi:hypothetical protein
MTGIEHPQTDRLKVLSLHGGTVRQCRGAANNSKHPSSISSEALSHDVTLIRVRLWQQSPTASVRQENGTLSNCPSASIIAVRIIHLVLRR